MPQYTNYGRVNIALTVEYPELAIFSQVLSSNYFLCVLPYHNPLDNNGQYPPNFMPMSDYINGAPNNVSILPYDLSNPNSADDYKRRLHDLFTNKNYIFSFNGQNDFFSMFSSVVSINNQNTKIKIMSDALSIPKERQQTLVAVFHLLRYVPLKVIFLPIGSNGYQVPNYFSLLNDILTQTTITEDFDFFLELGLRVSYGNIGYSILQTFITQLNNYDYMCILDAPIFKLQDDYPTNNYKVIKLSGWYIKDNLLIPPSVLYSVIISNNNSTNNKFGSIVNKVYAYNQNIKKVDHISRQYVQNIISDIRNGNSKTNSNITTESGTVFLTDVTCHPDSDMLKFENAVRAAIHGKKIINRIGKYFIGKSQESLDHPSIERMINNIFVNSIKDKNIKIYVIVDPDENIVDNTLIIRMFIEVGVSVWEVKVKVSAQSV